MNAFASIQQISRCRRVSSRRLLLLSCALVMVIGCGKPRAKPVTEHQRKEAEHLVAEASFAMNLRDWARAEGLLAKAVKVTPDVGAYWVNLGSTRVRLGNKSGAKDAYQSAIRSYELEANAKPQDADPWLKQVPVLALLGRVDDARALLTKTAKKFPDNRAVRVFVEGKHLDKMMADPSFKQGAL
jgi:tetratricopeptide (TPR) repeat protein